MKTVLVVGVESVAGANAAVIFSSRFQVIGLSALGEIAITGCEIRPCTSHDPATVRQVIQGTRPAWILFCGAAARSTWDRGDSLGIDDGHACTWAGAAREADIDFTLLSSDAVFSGPWISHPEDDEHFCSTPHAARIRQVEQAVLETHPEALVVRTHVFGWSPAAKSEVLVDCLLSRLEERQPLDVDCVCHASPLLATDLAMMLMTAFDEGITGLLHLAGGERTNPFDFADRLAQACELPRPVMPKLTTLTEPISGFGCGETTLDCSVARELLGIRPPMLEDGLRGLLAQRGNGHRAKLMATRASVGKVA